MNCLTFVLFQFGKAFTPYTNPHNLFPFGPFKFIPFVTLWTLWSQVMIFGTAVGSYDDINVCCNFTSTFPIPSSNAL